MIARGPTLAADRTTWTGSVHIVDLPSRGTAVDKEVDGVEGCDYRHGLQLDVAVAAPVAPAAQEHRVEAVLRAAVARPSHRVRHG